MTDREANRFSARAARYARVGANVSGVAARIAGARILGLALDRGKNAIELAAALGGLKGPIMKVAQLLATIPDALPPEYAAELMKLQSDAPPMGWAFVKRRMAAELGPDWRGKFASFEHHPAAAASLGQVHRARTHDGSELACKLQYADMQSAVEADLRQLQLIFAIHRRMDPVIDTTEIAKALPSFACHRSGPSFRQVASSPSIGSMATGCSRTRTTSSQPATSSARPCSLRGGGRSAAMG